VATKQRMFAVLRFGACGFGVAALKRLAASSFHPPMTLRPVSIRHNHVHVSARVEFVRPPIFGLLTPITLPVMQEVLKWTATPAGNAAEADAATLAAMAVEKWRLTCEYGLVAGNIDDFKSLITADSKADISAFLALKQDQVPSFPIGVCLIHRTWTNNLFVDFLAGNPTCLNSIAGIGKAFLYAVSEIAVELQSPRIWAETTATSAPIYGSILRREPESVGDELSIPLDEAKAFIHATDERWNVLVDRASE
jgi:hypothetical protein